MSFIRDAECAVISAECPSFDINENIERNKALKIRLFYPFRQNVHTLVFDCRLRAKSVTPQFTYLERFLLVARQPAFKGDYQDSAFLEQVLNLAGIFGNTWLFFLPAPKPGELRPAIRVFQKFGATGTRKPERFGSVDFDPEKEQFVIAADGQRLVFDVFGEPQTISPSMNSAYLCRALISRDYPGKPEKPRSIQPTTKNIKAAHRRKFSWSGDCAIQEMRYRSSSRTDANVEGGQS
jgi:hypothetical protein